MEQPISDTLLPKEVSSHAIVDEAIFAFDDEHKQAIAIAERLGLAFLPIVQRNFPDGESLVKVPDGAKKAYVYRSLHSPNEKLVELMLAVSALRSHGAKEIILISPYLPYMRQDGAFNRGEAVSQTVIGDLIGGLFDHIIAVDPHLHRTPCLSHVFGKGRSTTLTGAIAIANYYRQQSIPKDTLVLGPDQESEQWVTLVAGELGLEYSVAAKIRRGDRDVTVCVDNSVKFDGRHVLIVDDIISSGMTVLKAAQAARERGARSIHAAVTHALFTWETEAMLKHMGIRQIISCDGVPHSTNKIPLAPIIAEALMS